jgi:hypothetical protein
MDNLLDKYIEDVALRRLKEELSKTMITTMSQERMDFLNESTLVKNIHCVGKFQAYQTINRTYIVTLVDDEKYNVMTHEWID